MKLATAEYDAEAENYDSSRFSDVFGLYLDDMHKRILEDYVDRKGHLLLEVGIGTGRFGIWLAKRGFKVVGVDISREMLKKTREKANKLHSNVDMVLADVHYLPFRECLFDNCICINVTDHFSELRGFLEEVRYVIKPKGRFVFNFANFQSPYLPIAIAINLSGRALFKRKILSRWLTFKDIIESLAAVSFRVESVRGCMIASQIPLGKQFVPIVRIINSVSEQSGLRYFSGSVFLKVGLNKG